MVPWEIGFSSQLMGVRIMNCACAGFVTGTFAALLYLATALPASSADLERIEARFEIFGFAGLHVLTDRTTVQERGDRYAIATDLDTRGLASIFVDLTSHSEVHGKLARDGPLPIAYRADVRRNGEDRHYGIDYSGNGTVTNVSTTSSVEQPLLVAAQRLQGTVDQLTAYFLLEHHLAQHGTCARVVPVFDGSGLYNLRFMDVKRETLAADGYQNFAGPTQVCDVVRDDIFSNRNRNEDTYSRGRIWYARLLAGDRMMPVRMEFDTKFGTVRGYLAELRGRGIDLHLTRE